MGSEPWSVVREYGLGACWLLDNPVAACCPCMWVMMHGDHRVPTVGTRRPSVGECTCLSAISPVFSVVTRMRPANPSVMSSQATSNMYTVSWKEMLWVCRQLPAEAEQLPPAGTSYISA